MVVMLLVTPSSIIVVEHDIRDLLVVHESLASLLIAGIGCSLVTVLQDRHSRACIAARLRSAVRTQIT